MTIDREQDKISDEEFEQLCNRDIKPIEDDKKSTIYGDVMWRLRYGEGGYMIFTPEDVLSLLDTIEVRDDTIADKDKQIEELRAKVGELEERTCLSCNM